MKLLLGTRLTLFYCVLFFFSTALLEIAAYAGLRAAIIAAVDTDLQGRLTEVEDKLRKHPPDSPLIKLQNDFRTHVTLHPELLDVRESDGKVVFQGRAMRQMPGSARRSTPPSRTVDSGTGAFRILAARYRVRQTDYDIQVAADLLVPLQILQRFGLMLVLSLPVVLTGASIIGYWIARRALAPVTEIARAARSIGAAELSERVAVPESGDELQYLAETVNGMLERIEGAVRQISQFTANASHELRTPAAVIRTTAEVALLRTPENIDTLRDALHTILSEAQKNTLLLDDLLSLAKADAGTTVFRMEPVDLGSNMQDACEFMDVLARQKGVHLNLSLGGEPLSVLADAGYLRRLWLILIDNAVKYTPAGQRIQVRTSRAPGDSAVCEVEDTGIGIAPADLPHIFERFYRADKARARAEGGAGLGLAIAHWIVESHGARIEVQSAVGRGSTFRVCFPHLIPPPSGAPRISGSRKYLDAGLALPGKYPES